MNAENDLDTIPENDEPIKFCPICQKDEMIEVKSEICCYSCKIKYSYHIITNIIENLPEPQMF